MEPCYLPSQFPHEILQCSFTNPGVVPQKPVAANCTSQQFGHEGFAITIAHVDPAGSEQVDGISSVHAKIYLRDCRNNLIHNTFILFRMLQIIISNISPTWTFAIIACFQFSPIAYTVCSITRR